MNKSTFDTVYKIAILLICIYALYLLSSISREKDIGRYQIGAEGLILDTKTGKVSIPSEKEIREARDKADEE